MFFVSILSGFPIFNNFGIELTKNNMWNLEGRTAVVTGGSKGIGRATVEEFLKLGAKVLFTARNAEDIDLLQDQL